MTPERWQKIEEIFELAVELSGEEREKFLARECGNDSELREKVSGLLSRAEDAGSFLESPVWTDSLILKSELKKEIASSLEESETSLINSPLINRQIGVYRLIRELGKGGMGVVYLGERADGEFRQQVAVKLIKRGMDTDFIVKRFRRERQIAAALNHPNIARLLDGGTTSDGLPYFVLEYVEGEPFFGYVRANKLDLRKKIELFLAVCAAIIYAHKKKIVHRDVKPGNILVGEDGTPKLLDFGIAKILDPELLNETAMPTATQMRLMTPEYASPEQVRGEEVTEASDQYSLGVLLYELITGNRPYKFSSRAPHEIARIICEEIPSAPSSDNFEKNIFEKNTGKTFSEDFTLKLDRIVLKSLRKKRSERYATVRDFAADIERLLRNEPVLAESFADAKIIKTGEKSDRQILSAGQKSIAVLPFKTFDAISPGATTGGGNFLGIGLADAVITRLSNVRQFLVRPTSSILGYGERTTDSLAAGRELNVQYVLDGSIIKSGTRLRISVQLLEVGGQKTVWAERFDEDLTDVLLFEDQISEKVAESLVPHLTTTDRQNLAKRGTDLPKAYEAYLRGRFYRNIFSDESLSKAYAAYREAISIDPNYALAYAGIADYYIWLGVNGVVPPTDAYPLAKDAARRAIELDEDLGEAYASLAFAQICGDYDWIEAEKNAARAVKLSPNYSVARLWYSYVLLTAGRFEESLAQAKRAVELDPMTYVTHHALALNYYMMRRFDEALALTADNVKNFAGIGMAHQFRSWILRNLGKPAEALKAARKAIELSGESLFLLISYAQALAAAGKRAETEEILPSVFEQGKSQYLSYYQISLIYIYLGETEKALDALERAYEDREGWLIWLRTEPAFDPLRNEPQFIDLRRKIDRKTEISSLK